MIRRVLDTIEIRHHSSKVILLKEKQRFPDLTEASYYEVMLHVGNISFATVNPISEEELVDRLTSLAHEAIKDFLNQNKRGANE